MLNLEEAIELGETDEDQVDELTELYSDAVEYYNSKADFKRTRLYEDKL